MGRNAMVILRKEPAEIVTLLARILEHRIREGKGDLASGGSLGCYHNSFESCWP